MLSIHDLLEDSRYKEYFCRVPKLPAHAKSGAAETPAWVLYVRYHGESRWRKKECVTYPEAFKKLKMLIKRGRVADAAINCKRYSFAPPMRLVRIKGKYMVGTDGVRRQATKFVEWRASLPADEPDEHRWCPYCRRPTVFKWYSRHPALSKLGVDIDPSVRRCCICGASERISTYNRASEGVVLTKKRKR